MKCESHPQPDPPQTVSVTPPCPHSQYVVPPVAAALGLADAVEARNNKGSSNQNACFPILQTNSYGRMMIDKQMHTHDDLIGKCLPRTDSWISRVTPHYLLGVVTGCGGGGKPDGV